MRYFSYNEYSDDPDADTVVTVSTCDIRKEYYPFWYKSMCNKFGKEVVDRDYSFEDCLDDWIATNWAWEVTE
jgi:hypothetical protein